MSDAGATIPSERTQPRVRARLRGFTLVEVVVALFIILVLASVALPSVTGFLQQKRIDATADLLTDISVAINQFNSDIKTANPGRLSELSSPLIAGNANYATGTDDSCGGTFANKERDDWVGPYVRFLISRDSGMVTPIGLARDSLTRVPNSANNGNLLINFINTVELTDAKLLDEKMDGSNGLGTGMVQWVEPAVEGKVTMRFLIPIDNEC